MVSLPFRRPSATAARTAFSISCCEVTPTTLRNLRSDMFRASSFILRHSWKAGFRSILRRAGAATNGLQSYATHAFLFGCGVTCRYSYAPKAGVAELADAHDSKSCSQKECRFDPDHRHQPTVSGHEQGIGASAY